MCILVDANALVEAVSRGDGFGCVGYGVEEDVAFMFVGAGAGGGEKPVGYTGEGFPFP